MKKNIKKFGNSLGVILNIIKVWIERNAERKKQVEEDSKSEV